MERLIFIQRAPDTIIDETWRGFTNELNDCAVIDLDQESTVFQFNIRYARELLEIACKGNAHNALLHLRLARFKRLALGNQDPENLEDANQYYLKALKKEYTYEPAHGDETLMRRSLSFGVSGEYTQFLKLKTRYESSPNKD